MIRAPAILLAALCTALLTTGCDDQASVVQADPRDPGREAVGHYCGMILADHPGPKGQIFVEGRVDPYWFSSVRDAVAFTLLPEEPKRITGFYVNDAAKLGDWAHPDMDQWINAETAWYVIGSERRGGMGAAEAVPFKDKDDAAAFSGEFGGRVVALDGIPHDYILGDAEMPGGLPQADDPSHMQHAKMP